MKDRVVEQTRSFLFCCAPDEHMVLQEAKQMQEIDCKKSFHTAAQLLPERLWRAAYTLTQEQREQCEELRIRAGRPFAATAAGKTILLDGGTVIPTAEELAELLARATESSVHTYLEDLWQGYLTTKHGHRLGICGQAPGGDVRLLRGLSSVNIRIARPFTGLGTDLELCSQGRFRNTLILSPPGVGKTTLLRDLCRRLSQRFRIAVADERYEIAACMDGAPRFAVGNCDVLSGGRKQDSVPLLLRTMSPQIIAVDEITQMSDCRLVIDCVGCGCGLLATAHGAGAEDLRRRPVYQSILQAGVFEQVVTIRRNGSGRTYELQPL